MSICLFDDAKVLQFVARNGYIVYFLFVKNAINLHIVKL